MILERYSCEQYAGIQDLELSFEPGMNVVLGDNEAGKSTMISGIYNTLQMPIRLNLNRQTDKAFVARGFPANGANVIDGEIRLSVGGKRVSVKKEWDRGPSRDSRMVLRDMDSGVRLSGDDAQSALAALLQYGEGVYDHIIFGRQNNEEDVMSWFFSFLRKEDGKADVTAARERVSGALSAAGGISEELFLQKLEEKLKELGSRWDFSANMPEGRRDGKRWENGVGDILKAFYAWKDACAAYENSKQLMEEADRAGKTLDDKKKRQKDLHAHKAELQSQQAAIQNHSLLMEQKKALGDKLEALQTAKEAWPQLLEELGQLEELIAQQGEKVLRKKKEDLNQRLNNIAKCRGEMDRLQKAMEGKDTLEADAKGCRALQEEIDRAHFRLQSASLNAAVSLEPGRRATVETAEGTVAQAVQSFRDKVRGYAKITIPGVGEITVAPESVNVDALWAEIRDKEARITEVLGRYSVKNLEELDRAAEQYRTAKSDYTVWEGRWNRELGGQTTEDLSAELNGLRGDPSLAVAEDLEETIASHLARCGENSLDSRRAVVKSRLEAYREAYTSQSRLEAQIQETSNARKNTDRDLAATGQVSMTREEYEGELASIEGQLNKLDQEIEGDISALARLTQEADDIDLDALEEDRDTAEKDLERKKTLYAQYARIKADFGHLKENEEDPYGEFYDQFNRYLHLIAGENFSVSADGEIVSGKNSLDKKELLSQGTRKLVLLAFRLALLKYYYQEESGVIVLDDILLDMDPGRRERAARLLTEFAKGNQVIFTTCDPAIAQLLGGNQIKM